MTVFVLASGAVDETVTQDVIINAVVPALTIWRRTGEPLHAVSFGGALWKERQFSEVAQPTGELTNSLTMTSKL